MSRELFIEARGGILIQISAGMFSRIHYRRMDQASHNLLVAVGGWGVLLPPCRRTAVLAYHSVP